MSDNGLSLTKKIAGSAIFAGLAYVVSFLEFSIFPAADFLKMDFSSVFTLLAGFIYGPIFGVIVCAVKSLLFFTKMGGGGPIGVLTDFILSLSFVVMPTTVYRYRKGIKTVILTLIGACLIQTAVSLLVNRFISFPVYMGSSAGAVFNSLWYYIVAFNIIKTVTVSLITVLLYKRVSYLIKKL